jgi:anti-sigma factor RsiW
MSHLRDRLAALVDGELDHDGRDRVLAHLAACDECRREADDLRALKARLARLSDPPAPPELIARLLALGPPAPTPPPDPPCGPPPGSAVAPGTARPRGPRRPRRRPRRHRGSTRPGLGRPRATRFALVGGALAAAALGTAFAVGGPAAAPPSAVVPPAGSYAVEHPTTAREVPFGDLASVAPTTASIPAVTVSFPGATVPIAGQPAR